MAAVFFSFFKIKLKIYFGNDPHIYETTVQTAQTIFVQHMYEYGLVWCTAQNCNCLPSGPKITILMLSI